MKIIHGGWDDPEYTKIESGKAQNMELFSFRWFWDFANLSEIGESSTHREPSPSSKQHGLGQKIIDLGTTDIKNQRFLQHCSKQSSMWVPLTLKIIDLDTADTKIVNFDNTDSKYQKKSTSTKTKDITKNNFPKNYNQ